MSVRVQMRVLNLSRGVNLLLLMHFIFRNFLDSCVNAFESVLLIFSYVLSRVPINSVVLVIDHRVVVQPAL